MWPGTSRPAPMSRLPGARVRVAAVAMGATLVGAVDSDFPRKGRITGGLWRCGCRVVRSVEEVPTRPDGRTSNSDFRISDRSVPCPARWTTARGVAPRMSRQVMTLRPLALPTRRSPDTRGFYDGLASPARRCRVTRVRLARSCSRAITDRSSSGTSCSPQSPQRSSCRLSARGRGAPARSNFGFVGGRASGHSAHPARERAAPPVASATDRAD